MCKDIISMWWKEWRMRSRERLVFSSSSGPPTRAANKRIAINDSRTGLHV